MQLGEMISIVALAGGALMGFGALVWPEWARGVVRLVEDPDPARPGGYSEFRATYGGLFLMMHMTALIGALHLPPLMSAMMALPLAAGWIGAGIGRTLSLLADGTRNRAAGMIPVWIPFEIIFGLAIGANLIHLAT